IESGKTIDAAFYGFSNETSVINPEGTAFAINEYRVSEGFFSVFTEPLHMGRVFTPEDGFNNTILSYQTWRDVFGSDPNIVGATIRVNNAGLRVLGVAAEGFEFPLGTAIWTKIYQANGSENLFNLDGYARVKPGVTAGQFQAELDVFAGRLESDTAAVVGRGGAVGWEAGAGAGRGGAASAPPAGPPAPGARRGPPLSCSRSLLGGPFALFFYISF